jgi:hypothetical protein
MCVLFPLLEWVGVLFTSVLPIPSTVSDISNTELVAPLLISKAYRRRTTRKNYPMVMIIIYLMSQNLTLKNGSNDKFHILHISPQ